MRSACLEYQDILQWCSGVFEQMRVTRLRNFSYLVWSVLTTRQCTVASAARSVANGRVFGTNRQRMQRFFRWKTISIAEIGGYLVPLVIRRFPKQKPVSVILDTTSIIWHLNALVAAVPWRGRALPIGHICTGIIRPAEDLRTKSKKSL